MSAAPTWERQDAVAPSLVRRRQTFFELLWMWCLRDVRVRYKQSFLGVLWAILQPLALMVMFTVIFSYLAPVPSGGIPYPLFSYTGVLPWSLFAAMIVAGVPSLAANITLVTKVKMPREIIPVGVALANLADFGVASILFVGMFLFYQITLSWTVLWVIPLLVIQTVLALGVVLLGAALNVIYRDIRFIVPLAMQLWMYASPIIYPVDLVPEQWRLLYFLNPMAATIDGYRRVLLLGVAPDHTALAFALAVSALLFVLGLGVFRKLEPTFADII